MQNDKWKWYYTAAISSLAGILCYLNSLSADFVYDDSRAIIKNSDLLPTTPWSNVLFNDFWGTPLTHSGSHKSYRPLCVATFRINYYIGALNPFGYHLVNVLLHSAVCWLVVVLSYVFLHAHFPSLVAGLLFAVHPIHTEAVTGVVGRADVEACFFFIASFLAYIKSHKAPTNTTLHKQNRNQWPWLLLCFVMCVASMLSKEQGITVLGVCAVYEVIILFSSNKKQAVFVTLTKALQSGSTLRLFLVFFTGLGLLCLRILIMGKQAPDFSPSDNPAANCESSLTRLLTLLYLPAFNFWLLLSPRTLSFDWSMDSIPLVESLLDPRCAITVMFYGFLTFLGVYCLTRCFLCVETSIEDHTGDETVRKENPSVAHRKDHAPKNGKKQTRSTESSGGPSKDTNSYPPYQNNNLPMRSFNVTYRNNLLQAALIALTIVMFSFLPASNLFFYVGFVVAERILYIPSVGFCLLIAIGADIIWRACNEDQQRLFTGLLVCVFILSVARTVQRNWDWQNEETLYRSGISVNPAKAWSNLGNVLNSQRRVREAEDAYRKALSYRSNMADTHYNLGILLAEEQRYSEAVQSYQHAIHFRPRLAAAHLNLGIVLADMGHKEEAVKILRNASTISGHGLKDPKQHSHSIASIKYNLGRILAQLGRVEEALIIYLDAVETRPPHYEPHSLFNLIGEAYSATGNIDEAEKWYKESLKSKPDHLSVHLTYAKHLAKIGHFTEAEDWFKKAQALNKSDHGSWTHYGQFLYDQKRVVEAAAMFTKAMELAPGDFEIAFTAAGYLREIGDNVKAEKCYKTAVQLNPENPAAHMNLGAMLHLQGKLDEAEKSYMKALRLRPGDQLTEENLRKLRSLQAKRKV
ncbi:transmembrane and TPR repeat-containing protein 2-like [Orbicella faveolata]|uniref:transmembrane and TPR repeat-containing protein 2-like n=1 Tax=Orbicella faveolata TaxID=48498 RepID=UPI0009E3175D|nr:transmembrane and TPR repeat-containing protein 2-like [Orbicella faveolata]